MTKAVEKKAETTAKAVEAVKAPAAAAVKPVEAKSVEKTEKKAAPKAAKKETKKAAKTTKKAATKTAKKETKAAAATVKVFVEYQGKQTDMDAIVAAVKANAGVKTFKTLEVYVKPEDGAAYYVVNGKDSGKADL